MAATAETRDRPVTAGLFRLELPDGEICLASGSVEEGARRLLAPGLTIEAILREGVGGLAAAVQGAGGPITSIPTGARVLAPVDAQEVWAAGVTYERSRAARMEETKGAEDFYDKVYTAERPELFFKGSASRVSGHNGPIRIRRDAAWNVPEPEIALLVSAHGEIAGYTVGNDVSSRDIEGQNPLYLPQAKIYRESCALGPVVWLTDEETAPVFDIAIAIQRRRPDRKRSASDPARSRAAESTRRGFAVS